MFTLVSTQFISILFFQSSLLTGQAKKSEGLARARYQLDFEWFFKKMKLS